VLGISNFKKYFSLRIILEAIFFIYWVIFVDFKISILRGATGKSDGGRGIQGWLLSKSSKFFLAKKYGPPALSVAPTVHISLPNFADNSKKNKFSVFLFI
jgi:hypothetical protein